jgi:hypothetical protein
VASQHNCIVILLLPPYLLLLLLLLRSNSRPVHMTSPFLR